MQIYHANMYYDSGDQHVVLRQRYYEVSQRVYLNIWLSLKYSLRQTHRFRR